MDRLADVGLSAGDSSAGHVTTRAIVIGAGWSGIAAALALADAGVDVTLLDAAPQPGGRARRVDVVLGDRRYALDNGQHLLIGAYSETLRLMRRVGVDPRRALLRIPFALRYPDGFLLRAARAPAPLHLAAALLGARGFTVAERMALAASVASMRRSRWQLAPDRPAIELFTGHPARLVERVWQPLCVAALNARLEQASAAMLLTVLRDSLGAAAAASDLLLPRGDLSALLPDAALDALQVVAAVRLRTPAIGLRARRPRGWSVATRGAPLDADAVVLAVPPARAADLLASVEGAPDGEAVALLRAIDTAPIATVYLRYEEHVCLPCPIYALREDAPAERYGQWVFDRGALDESCAGVMAVVVSAEGPHLHRDRDAVVAAVARQLSADFGLPAPLAATMLTEKHATIVPAPGLQRPPARLATHGLYLAGDAAESPYPSTLEGSVRAGLAAADAVLADAGLPPRSAR
ncbi:MAG: hydroxysqualene dehydroxylase HpnE [Burkholderiaceae bacterium]